MDINLTLIYFFCAFLNIVLGTIAYLINRKSKSNKYFLFFTVSQAFWIISLYLLYYSIDPYNPGLSNISVKSAYGFSLLLSASFTAFVYQFPRVTYKISKLTKKIFVLITLSVLFLTVFTNLIYEKQIVINNTYQDDVLGPLYLIYLLFLLIQFLVALYIGINKILKLHGIDRKKIIIVLIGIGSFGFFSILINVILPVFEIYIFYRLTVIFSLLFLLPAFYSIQKHRFFNISYVSLETLRITILLSIFIFSTLGINYLLLNILIPTFHNVLIFIISICCGLFIWIKIQKIFPHLIPGDFAKLQRSISKLQASIPLCNTFPELENLLEKTFIIDLNISSIKCFVTRNTQVDTNLPIYIKDQFTEELEKYKNDLLVQAELEYINLPKTKKDNLLRKMDFLDATICMPLFAEHKLIGFLTIGNKEKNKLYTEEELKQIIKIKSQLEIALTNFLLKLNLQEENNLMKELIEQKTKKLQNQFQDIKNLLEQQSDFIAVTAHEFRTPLSIAMFQLEDTISTYKHTPQVVKDMEVMAHSLNNLKNLTQTLFDIQQYDLNKIKLNIKKVNINDFINKIYREFEKIMNEHKIEFKLINKVNKSLEIELDEHQIRQIFSNLLNNAIKFSNSDNPQITIEAYENTNSIQIAIIDNGEGIPDNDKERVFEKFQTTKISMGTGIGLGLYICKKIIELHEGKIWIEDNEPVGTKFIFELTK